MFSEREMKILKILGRKKMMIADITKEYYKGAPTPLNPKITIASAIRRIAAKCEHYKLDWTVKGEGAGRTGRKVWKEKK